MQHVTVNKEWGKEIWIVNSPLYCGKKLVLCKGWQCSLHYHTIKDETFHLLTGRVRLEHGKDVTEMRPGDTVRIHPQQIHRFAGLENSVILEISTHHSDEDVYRIENSKPITWDGRLDN